MIEQGELGENIRAGRVPGVTRSKEMNQVIQKMLQVDPALRPTASMLLQEPSVRAVLKRRQKSNWVRVLSTNGCNSCTALLLAFWG